MNNIVFLFRIKCLDLVECTCLTNTFCELSDQRLKEDKQSLYMKFIHYVNVCVKLVWKPIAGFKTKNIISIIKHCSCNILMNSWFGINDLNGLCL